MTPPYLTICIPSRNRAKNLSETIAAFAQIISKSLCREEVELVCVDNFSSDLTPQIIKKAAQDFTFFRGYKQQREKATAESSACGALEFARGEYVWLFGDDDIPVDGCIDKLIGLLKIENPDFALLNARLKLPNRTIDYIQATENVLRFPEGRELFKIFGLISATTTLSCLCLRRAAFDIRVFEKLNAISEIYSHSFAFFVNFCRRPALFIAEPLLDYRQNLIGQERARMALFARKTNISCFHPFVFGVIELCKAAASLTGIPLRDIVEFEELEISKSSWIVKRTLLWCFVARMLFEMLNRNWLRLPFSAELLQNLVHFFDEVGDDSASLFARHLEVLGTIRTKRSYLVAVLRFRMQLNNVLDEVEEAHCQKVPEQTGASLYFQKGVAPRPLPANAPPAPAGNVRLTVLIPTYARPEKLDRNIDQLCASGLHVVGNVEWVVAVNSDSETESYYRDIERKNRDRFPRLRFVFHETFVFSAEESIDRSLPCCRGEYVQLLGDDDVLLPVSFCFLQSLLRRGEQDVYIFNSLNVSDDRYVSPSRHCYMGSHPFPAILVPGNYESLVRQYGITTTMAFISRYVFRKTSYLSYADLIAVSSVYSHVFGFLRSFKGRPCLLVDYPLVVRHDSKVEERFEEMARLTNTKSFYPWTDGLFQLAEAAVGLGIIPPDYLVTVTERPVPSRSFMLWHEMLNQFIRQTIRDAKAPHDSLSTEGGQDHFMGFVNLLLRYLNIPDKTILLGILNQVHKAKLRLRNHLLLADGEVKDLFSYIDLICRGACERGTSIPASMVWVMIKARRFVPFLTPKLLFRVMPHRLKRYIHKIKLIILFG